MTQCNTSEKCLTNCFKDRLFMLCLKHNLRQFLYSEIDKKFTKNKNKNVWTQSHFVGTFSKHMF